MVNSVEPNIRLNSERGDEVNRNNLFNPDMSAQLILPNENNRLMINLKIYVKRINKFLNEQVVDGANKCFEANNNNLDDPVTWFIMSLMKVNQIIDEVIGN